MIKAENLVKKFDDFVALDFFLLSQGIFFHTTHS